MALLEARHRRKAAAERRRERLEAAAHARDQVNAAFDYFRAAARSLPDEEADRHRLAVADYLVATADRIRK